MAWGRYKPARESSLSALWQHFPHYTQQKHSGKTGEMDQNQSEGDHVKEFWVQA